MRQGYCVNSSLSQIKRLLDRRPGSLPRISSTPQRPSGSCIHQQRKSGSSSETPSTLSRLPPRLLARTNIQKKPSDECSVVIWPPISLVHQTTLESFTFYSVLMWTCLTSLVWWIHPKSNSLMISLSMVSENIRVSIQSKNVDDFTLRPQIWHRTQNVCYEERVSGTCSMGGWRGRCGCYLSWRRCAILIRPDKDDPGSYQIVGECYVHGVMDGEAFEECMRKGKTPADFKFNDKPLVVRHETREFLTDESLSLGWNDLSNDDGCALQWSAYSTDELIATHTNLKNDPKLCSKRIKQSHEEKSSDYIH